MVHWHTGCERCNDPLGGSQPKLSVGLIQLLVLVMGRHALYWRGWPPAIVMNRFQLVDFTVRERINETRIRPEFSGPSTVCGRGYYWCRYYVHTAEAVNAWRERSSRTTDRQQEPLGAGSGCSLSEDLQGFQCGSSASGIRRKLWALLKRGLPHERVGFAFKLHDCTAISMLRTWERRGMAVPQPRWA